MGAQLQHRIDASSYLSRVRAKTGLATDQTPDELLGQLQSGCDGLNDYEFNDDFASAEQFLIGQKQRFAFCWSLCELQDILSQPERGRWQTRFAECTIEFALRLAWREVATKHAALKKQFNKTPNRLPGLFILGMGKLGGDDLNFSSDVDLVAYFDPGQLPVPEMLGKSYICHQMLQSLTRVLGQNGQTDFIWRVDWRLRPNASATTLAMSTEAAEEYYFYRASPWHRLALMKARVVAGDMSVGKEFVDTLAPFIWRQNLDYRALDELADIKQRINLEHPALRTERQWREPIIDQVAGFNVKLGTGGIREIEFIVNALQLVWGGKQYELRTANTLEALAQLSAKQHLDPNLANKLGDSYLILRRLENGIQMLGNQQSHLLPSDESQQDKLLTLLDIKSWVDLVDQLNQYRRVVSEHFESLFSDRKGDQQRVIIWPEQLSDTAKEIVEAWENGFHQYGISNQRRHRLLPLAKALANYLSTLDADDQNSADASATVRGLHDFFRSLPQGEQYFRLLAESPMLLESIIPPLLYSPPMTTLLRQSPHIIDCYMQAPWRYPENGFDTGYVMHAEQYEVQLERLRRFVNEYLYQLYLRFMQHDMTVDDFQFALSDLAEQTLELTLNIVAKNMGLSESPISVVGMGKIALRRMSPTSDLDLIFIFDPARTSLDLASRFVSRLRTAISTPMREGIVYELDTRLRPSGRSGAPTVSIDSFRNHQLQRAHSWEHIALVPSRVVAGDKNLINGIDQVKRDVITRPRDQTQFLKDAIKMWQRISEHRLIRHEPDIMFSKLRIGGLMQSEYLSACLILSTDTRADSVAFDDLLNDALRDSDIINLAEITQFWRIQQIWERLLGKTGLSLDSIPNRYMGVLLEQSGVDNVTELIDKKIVYAEQVQRATEQFFRRVDDPEFDLEEWLETRVNWQ